MASNLKNKLAVQQALTDEEKLEVLEMTEQVWCESIGIDRLEEGKERLRAPSWAKGIKRMPERLPDGSLPGFGLPLER